MYDTYAVASQVIHELQEAGIPQSDLSLVANADAHGRYTAEHGTRTTSDVTGGGTHPADPAEPDDTNAEAGAKRGLLAVGLLVALSVCSPASVPWQFPAWDRSSLRDG
jgi:hypothetical protein